MEANRLHLREILQQVMVDCDEEPRLYYQPDSTFKLAYPCMLYHLRTLTKQSADNTPYFRTISFDVTYITKSPLSKVPTAMLEIPCMSFDRYYTSENLHHYAYTYTENLKKGE